MAVPENALQAGVPGIRGRRSVPLHAAEHAPVRKAICLTGDDSRGSIKGQNNVMQTAALRGSVGHRAASVQWGRIRAPRGMENHLTSRESPFFYVGGRESERGKREREWDAQCT